MGLPGRRARQPPRPRPRGHRAGAAPGLDQLGCMDGAWLPADLRVSPHVRRHAGGVPAGHRPRSSQRRGPPPVRRNASGVGGRFRRRRRVPPRPRDRAGPPHHPGATRGSAPVRAALRRGAPLARQRAGSGPRVPIRVRVSRPARAAPGRGGGCPQGWRDGRAAQPRDNGPGGSGAGDARRGGGRQRGGSRAGRPPGPRGARVRSTDVWELLAQRRAGRRRRARACARAPRTDTTAWHQTLVLLALSGVRPDPWGCALPADLHGVPTSGSESRQLAVAYALYWGRVSTITPATTTPEANVRAAIALIANGTLNASARSPAAIAPTAYPASRHSR